MVLFCPKLAQQIHCKDKIKKLVLSVLNDQEHSVSLRRARDFLEGKRQVLIAFKNKP